MVAKDPKMVTAMELMNPYEKPPSMSVSQSMKTFLYNRETGAFMGRTASSWGKSAVLPALGFLSCDMEEIM